MAATLRVRGWGDQHRAIFETLDRHTVVENPRTGCYEYAALAADGKSLVASGRQAETEAPAGVELDPNLLRHHVAALQEDRGLLPRKARWQLRRERYRALRRSLARGEVSAEALERPGRQTRGDFVGLCLPVQFPDEKGAIPEPEIAAFCNLSGYREFGNRCSVYDYFLDNSGGRLRYVTVVAPYYTARQRRAYYTDPEVPWGERVDELIGEAVDYHHAQGLDVRALTADRDGRILATNVLYAGGLVNAFQKGLWPNAWHLPRPRRLGPDRFAYAYQITEMCEELTLGTYCHENGHLLCDFPDLYDLGPEKGDFVSGGVGAYCLMGYGGERDPRNPTDVCAYLKYTAGWADSAIRATDGLQVTLRAGHNDFVVHRRDDDEYYIIENRHRSARDGALPDSGLAIWHVDEAGDNNLEQMLPERHYECSLVQADARHQLERQLWLGDRDDLFHAEWRDRFAGDTTPRSAWWDGSPAGLDVFDISAEGRTMTFRVNARGGAGP
jgi:M6 family metalloprotease-like protein